MSFSAINPVSENLRFCFALGLSENLRMRNLIASEFFPVIIMAVIARKPSRSRINNGVAAGTDFHNVQAVLVAAVGKQAESAVNANVTVRIGNGIIQIVAVLIF